MREVELMPIEHAINIARLWRAGKMVGWDEDIVRNTLLHEVEKLRGTALLTLPVIDPKMLEVGE